MKKTYTLIILLGYISLLSIAEATKAFAPFNDDDLITYGSSDPQFKASVWLDPHCSASRVRLSENDIFDFYITAAHCVGNISNEGFQEAEKIYQQFLEKGLFDLETIEYDENWERMQIIYSLVRDAIDLNLIDSPLPTFKDFFNLIQSYVANNHLLKDTDKISFKDLKCIKHPDYKDINDDDDSEEEQDNEDDDNEEKEDNDLSRDLALCTSYKKNANIPYYKLKFINDYRDFLKEQLISVSFGIRNRSTNTILNQIPARQAFNVFVQKGWESDTMESMPNSEKSIIEGPTGYCDSGDSGGALLYKNNDSSYSLLAVTEAGGGGSHWTLLDKYFIEEAYKQLMQETLSEEQKLEL